MLRAVRYAWLNHSALEPFVKSREYEYRADERVFLSINYASVGTSLRTCPTVGEHLRSLFARFIIIHSIYWGAKRAGNRELCRRTRNTL